MSLNAEHRVIQNSEPNNHQVVLRKIFIT